MKKWIALAIGALFIGVAAICVFLMWEFGRDETDQSFERAVSPDGKLIAEIRQNITGPWGGPDTVYVTISGEKVYARTYECMDHTAFHLQWKAPDELGVAYGSCNTGRWRNKGEDTVWLSEAVWHRVKIGYEDTGYVATR
jgi:hypothetical protein